MFNTTDIEMPINKILTENIENQFTANNKLNLYYKNIDFQSHFLEETKNVIRKHKLELLQLDSENQSEKWVEVMTEKALDTFCNNNQFIDTRNENVAKLHHLYKVLWNEIVEVLKADEVDFEAIQKSHVKRLTNWLDTTNGFARELNDPASPLTLEITCAEYSAEFQLKLLDIDLETIVEPVLDIGCGKNANLVKYLRKHGIEAYGLDRLCSGNDHYFRVDWLDFDFQPHTWGTIISNLSFALHFTNHHHRKDGEYILYARKYMEILNSLTIPGTFYYAPGLPFIEAYLPKDKYKTFTHRINENFSFTRVSTF